MVIKLLSEKQALDVIEEYVEKWPYSMGEKHMARWISHLQKLRADTTLKAFDNLIMTKEKPFSFDALRLLAQSYEPKNSLFESVAQWKKEIAEDPIKKIG